MEDVRKLASRQPPEGLLNWAEEHCPELRKEGLLIETQWVEDWGLETLLDEWSQGKKVRAIRARCSACTESGLLWRQRDGYGRYGFIHPDRWTGGCECDISVHGDEVTCPFCGEPVVVIQKSKVGRKGYFVTGQAQVMSAAVVGRDKLLVLTGWTVQQRIYANARRELAAIPAEAYVFSPTDCAQLMGWVNSYSGTAGYYVQYTRSWRQPKAWSERWGAVSQIFGLTPQLIAESCLPHCKLDVYMQPRIGCGKRYPVAWLRLYQTHPNVEGVLTRGLPQVLDELFREIVTGRDWENNRKGLAELAGLCWEQTRPAQMLGLTKNELAMARQMGWGLVFWRLFIGAKALGERLTEADIRNAFYFGDEHVTELVGRGPVGKSLRYLLRQCELAGVEDEGDDPDPNGAIDVQILLDYWDMAQQAGYSLEDPAVRWPRHLLEAHDHMAGLAAAKEDHALDGRFRVRRKQLARYAFQAGGLLIRPAKSQRELKDEGERLSHCVATYGKRHAAGQTAIFFIRRRGRLGTPYYTLELDERTMTVLQNRGKRNCPRTPEVEAFEQLWVAWLHAGAPRDRAGRPVIPRKKEVGVA